MHVIAQTALEWLPSLVILVVGTILTMGLQIILRKRSQHSSESQTGIGGSLFVLGMTAVVVVTVVLVLPVGDSTKGQLLSLFGLLVTGTIALSSTTILGNAMAGLMLRAIRHFSAGDFLHVGEHFGRVSDQGLLHTEIQTEFRDLTTLPNLYLVTNPVTVMRASGTVVSACVSLGYDVNHERVEKVLIAAVEAAGLKDAFVRVEDLGDFSVLYRAAGFLSDVRHVVSTRSRIRSEMLDALHGDGIEIVSPAFMNQRVLSPRDTVISQPQVRRTRTKTAIPESRIFDKAEEAESRERVKAEIEKEQARLHELKSTLEKESVPDKRLEVTQEIDDCHLRIDSLKECLAEMDAQSED